jgi:hypothetical protein
MNQARLVILVACDNMQCASLLHNTCFNVRATCLGGCTTPPPTLVCYIYSKYHIQHANKKKMRGDGMPRLQLLDG